MKTPERAIVVAKSTIDKHRESITQESYWENDFSSMPDEVHYRPFDAAVDSAASTVLIPS